MLRRGVALAGVMALTGAMLSTLSAGAAPSSPHNSTSASTSKPVAPISRRVHVFFV